MGPTSRQKPWCCSDQHIPSLLLFEQDADRKLSLLSDAMLFFQLCTFGSVKQLSCCIVCLQVSVRGMHCASCSGAVERALKAQPGVHTANVALLKETAEVQHSPWVKAG